MEKIFLEQGDFQLGPTALARKYNLSGRGNAFHVLKRGYFIRDAHRVSEKISEEWFRENYEIIQSELKSALSYKLRSRMIVRGHRLLKMFLNDIYQEALLVVYLKSGFIEESNGKKLFTVACNALDKTINKYLFYGDGGHTVEVPDFWEEHSLHYSSLEEESIDEILKNVESIITSSLGKNLWEELWNWALSKKTKCPENILSQIKSLGL